MPSIWNRLFQSRARDKPAGKQNGDSPPEGLRHVSRTRADVSMTGSEAIYAAVSRIANTVASTPVHLFKGYELQKDDPRERLLAYAPGPSSTPFTFIQTLEAFRNTEGRAYALMVPRATGGGVERLDVLDPARVTPRLDPATREMWYTLGTDDGPLAVHGAHVLAFKHMSANGEMGIRPLDVLRGTLDYDKQIKEFSLDQLEGVNNGVILNVPNTGLSEAQKDSAIQRFMDAYKKSSGSVVVLDGGITTTMLTRSPIDSRVLDVERVTRNKVATVYNIPPHLLGDYTDTSFSTAEQQMQEFLQLTILPILAQWEQELNRKMLTYKEHCDGYRFRFDMDALIRADIKAMAEKHQIAVRGSWYTPNEVREKEGKAPKENGDELMIARDLIPLRIAVQHPELLLSGKNEPNKEVK